MAEKPMIFSTPMVQALLECRNTQTRRIIRPQPIDGWSPEVGFYNPTKIDKEGEEYPSDEVFGASDDLCGRVCRYQIGDVVWVRENFQAVQDEGNPNGHDKYIYYRASESHPHLGKWKPSIHMPRWAARIFLEITDVRVQRLQEISEEDILAEGVKCPFPVEVYCEKGFQDHFKELWSTIHKPDSPNGWNANPWVFAYTFKRIKH